jgi:hypothetical protein
MFCHHYLLRMHLDVLDIAVVFRIFLGVVSSGRKGIRCDGVEGASSTIGDLDAGDGDWGPSD